MNDSDFEKHDIIKDGKKQTYLIKTAELDLSKIIHPPSYGGNPNQFGSRSPIEVPFAIAELLVGKTVCDLGCYYGDHIPNYAQCGATKIIAVEKNTKIRKEIKRRFYFTGKNFPSVELNIHYGNYWSMMGWSPAREAAAYERLNQLKEANAFADGWIERHDDLRQLSKHQHAGLRHLSKQQQAKKIRPTLAGQWNGIDDIRQALDADVYYVWGFNKKGQAFNHCYVKLKKLIYETYLSNPVHGETREPKILISFHDNLPDALEISNKIIHFESAEYLVALKRGRIIRDSLGKPRSRKPPGTWTKDFYLGIHYVGRDT